jgi:hypothetical protein
MRRRTRLHRLLILLACALTAVLVAGTQPASASAFGTAPFGPQLPIDGVSVPAGSYDVYISGTGTYVSYVEGWPYMNTPVSGTICNWNITAEFFDISGQWYRTLTGPTHLDCNSYFNQADADFISINDTVQAGLMCSTLKSNGARLTSVCHKIQ